MRASFAQDARAVMRRSDRRPRSAPRPPVAGVDRPWQGGRPRMKRQQALTVEGAVELPHVIGYLEALVQALKSGAAKVQRGDEQVVLGPRGVVGFSLAAVDKGKRQK